MLRGLLGIWAVIGGFFGILLFITGEGAGDRFKKLALGLAIGFVFALAFALLFWLNGGGSPGPLPVREP